MHYEHSAPTPDGYCSHCGQRLPRGYGERPATNRVGVGITIALHVLLLGAFLLRDEAPEKKAAPPAGPTMVYIKPRAPTPTPPKPPQQARATPSPRQITPPKVVAVAPLPPSATAITVPVETAPPPPVLDFEAQLAEKRRLRAQAQAAQPAEESEAERGLRIARANIQAAQGKAGADANDSGGVFTIMNQTAMSADVKFRGWNPNFKRRWAQQVHVERGLEVDLETAIVKKMIELIRKEKDGDFVWDSHRLGRHVNLSARVQDTAELHAFLMREMFPEYRPPRG